MHLAKLKEMFAEMTIKKNADLIAEYYHPEFKLYCNGEVMDYKKFHDDHVAYYKTDIQYQVRYDEETLVEQGDRVAGRMFITVSNPGEEPKELEVMLVGQYKDGKIYRIWELTFPDWSKLPEFDGV